jgi:hypothetical protein
MAVKLFTIAKIDIPSAGTRVQVSATATPISTIIASAPAANTGKVYIGDDAVAAGRGVEIAPGGTVSLSADYSGTGEEFLLSDFYVDAATNGDDISISYIKRK